VTTGCGAGAKGISLRDSFAALRQDFPEAAVRNGLKGRNPNRPFAAGEFDVSVAGQSTISLRLRE
jgi:hypothetical protein